MCSDGEFHCGNEFRTTLWIFNPHKRRAELTRTGRYRFESQKCEHGYRNVRDYRMIEINKLPENSKERDIRLLIEATK